MPGRSFRIARIAGIPVGVSPWWVVIVGLITWSLGTGYYPYQVHGLTDLQAYALGLTSVLLLFASILTHEFGHALVARRRGLKVEEIDLWLLGGVARISGQPKRAEDELSFAAAGPAVTAVISALFGVVSILLPPTAPAALRALVTYEWEVNLMILGFNLVPAFPLDGGRIARALLWRRRGDIDSATETATRLGRAFGYVLITMGVLLALGGAPLGLWAAVIGVFLVSAAGAERYQEQVVTMFTGISAGQLMSQPAVSLSAEATLDEAAAYFARYRFTAFPVVDLDGRAQGMLRIDQLQRADRRRTASVRQVMNSNPALRVARTADVAGLLADAEFLHFGRAVVIDGMGRPVGVLSLTDVQRALRASSLTPAGGSAAVRSPRDPVGPRS